MCRTALMRTACLAKMSANVADTPATIRHGTWSTVGRILVKVCASVMSTAAHPANTELTMIRHCPHALGWANIVSPSPLWFSERGADRQVHGHQPRQGDECGYKSHYQEHGFSVFRLNPMHPCSGNRDYQGDRPNYNSIDLGVRHCVHPIQSVSCRPRTPHGGRKSRRARTAQTSA